MYPNALTSNPLATESVSSIKEILDKTDAHIKRLGIHPKHEGYKHLVLQEAEKYALRESQVKELANVLGIHWLSPPRIANGWVPSLCKIYMSVKYTNPQVPQEFIVMVSSKTFFGVKAIIHHTPNGYLNKSWFTDFVPDLDMVAKNYLTAIKTLPPGLQRNQFENINRRLFSSNVNDPVNSAYPNGMSMEQLRAMNAFFHKYLPDVEGICNTCFRLSLPRSGPGIRWYSPQTHHCEVRLSEPKPTGYPSQQKLYLTHNYQVNQETLHVKWNGIFSDTPTLDRQLKQHNTHIPWEMYDYAFIVEKLPEYKGNKFLICQCKVVH